MHTTPTRSCLFILFCCLNPPCAQAVLHAAASDTLYSDPLREVTVTGRHTPDVERGGALHQSLRTDSRQASSSLLVSDAVKLFAGATVRDYGGLGGMKTLSLRGMGAHHTAVAYDGITLTDGQTGQIDLGKYALDNLEVVSLTIGEGTSLFQPARMHASAGLLALRTKRPRFDDGQRIKGEVALKGGSFGLIQPDMALHARVRSSTYLSVSGHYVGTRGDYPFKLAYGDAPDAYTVERRQNNKSEAIRLESSLFADLPRQRTLEAKVYYHSASKGLPGAIILYNPQSGQRVWDRNGFVQTRYVRSLSKRTRWQFNAKYGVGWQRYLNTEYLGSTGREDQRYRQDELYASAVYLHTPVQNWSLAWASDATINRMRANLFHFTNPYRFTWLHQASAAYTSERFQGSVRLLGTLVNEEALDGEPASDRWALNPGLNVSYKPLAVWPLRIRAFYKSSYRMPSFNDLYYAAVGNRRLRPEQGRQFDIGFSLRSESQRFGTRWTASVDGYTNRITDKIQALPTKNIFVWSMVNLGKVSITGLDLTTSLEQHLAAGWDLMAAWNHSYQRALDKTDKTSPTYNHQLAYAPRVYGSICVGLNTPWAVLTWSNLWSGHRYVTGQNLAENDLPGYADHSVTLEKGIECPLFDVNLKAEVLNLLGTSYEVIRNFPMPGRSYRLSVKLTWR